MRKLNSTGKNISKGLLISAMLFWTFNVNAFESAGGRYIDKGNTACYDKAMIGFDTVINARLGVSMSTALAVLDDEGLLNVFAKTMVEAYDWKHHPHDYALNVFATCIEEKTK